MPKYLQSGVTLIELLISITIISLLAVFTFPNIKKFNRNQAVANTGLELSDNLKNAQSRALSAIRCSSTLDSTNWFIQIDKATKQISLKASCSNASSITASQVNYPATVDISSTSCDSILDFTYPIFLQFDKNGFIYGCFTSSGGSVVGNSNPFQITFTDTADTTQVSTITISTGGVIVQK